MTDITSLIIGSQKVTDVFGCWPSFHDAEVLAVRMDRTQKALHKPSLEADIHVWNISNEVDGNGYFKLTNETLVTFRFEGIDELSMNGFNHQNVLSELKFSLEDGDLSGALNVAFEATFGLDASFRCSKIVVLRSEPWVKGRS